MKHNEIFKEIYGDTLPAGKNAYVMDMPLDAKNPIKVVGGHIPKGAKVTLRSGVLYILAERFTHKNATKLSFN